MGMYQGAQNNLGMSTFRRHSSYVLFLCRAFADNINVPLANVALQHRYGVAKLPSTLMLSLSRDLKWIQ